MPIPSSDAAPPIRVATRGSALALAQARAIQELCRRRFPDRTFELRIIKTTGDKLQSASLSNPGESLPKGLFTKELEVALLNGDAELAVHSLKDLPTRLPDGLTLGAVTAREDVRDVLIARQSDFPPGSPLSVDTLPEGAVVATSSVRRRLQLTALRPDLRIQEIRGNIGTRLEKIRTRTEWAATILAAAGLCRLKFEIDGAGQLSGPGVPDGLVGHFLETDLMLPCVGQAAIGLEIRGDHPEAVALCAALNHRDTWDCVLAERAFLREMDGGCHSPVAALGAVRDRYVRLDAVWFDGSRVGRASGRRIRQDAEDLGRAIAGELKG